MSNINCDSDTVNVYDSAYAFINMDTKLQICSIVRPSCDVLTLRMPTFNVSRIHLIVEYFSSLQQQSLLWEEIPTYVTGTQPR